MSTFEFFANAELWLVLDLIGTFAFALNGALTAVHSARVDIFGALTLGIITAIGGGTIRDVLMGATPPATFSDWRYIAVATVGGLLAFLFSNRLRKLAVPIELLDAAGLSLFAVTGATKAMSLGAGPLQAIILGTVTAVGGGTIRDVMIRQMPGVLSSGLYAIPALLGALLVVALWENQIFAVAGIPVTIVAALIVFAVRVLALKFRLNAPRPPGQDAPLSDA